jgi:hypothetical protein
MYKAAEKWLWPYCKSVFNRPRADSGPTHVMLAICDHYEPLAPRSKKSIEIGDRRVDRWLQEWPKLASQFKDIDGKHPNYSIFYPAEEAEKPDRYIPMLKPLIKDKWAEIEVHLHHRNDTAESLAHKLNQFRDFLHLEHDLLGCDAQKKPGYAFIHGNWALCNSHPEGDWCGVNEELDVLLETGCYVDYTFPSIPSTTQPARFCNSIYYAQTIPGKNRSYDKGKYARVGYKKNNKELLLIQGPVGLNWKCRSRGIFPRIETGDLCSSNPPTPLRADLWIKQHVHVSERPDWIFVKLHTHGCIEGNTDVLLGDSLKKTFHHLENKYNDGTNFALHYVSAREMYNIAQAAIDGKSGDPKKWRDYAYRPPAIISKEVTIRS